MIALKMQKYWQMKLMQKIYKLDTVLTGATDKSAYIDAANRNLEVLKSVLGDEK